MPTVRANIERDGSVIAKDVSVWLNEFTDGGLKSWNGSFTPPSPALLFEPGDECRLLLRDGRSGSFFVSRFEIRTGHASVVQFVGSGGLE